MSYSSETTRRQILSCAKKEFLREGYQKANLRRIVREAKATTGALYHYHHGKKALFEALVKEPAEEMLETFRSMHEGACARVCEQVENHEKMQAFSDRGTDWMIDFIYSHWDACKLLFCQAKGSSYEDYVERLIAIEEQTYRSMVTSGGKEGSVSPFFIHVACTSAFREIVEVVDHDLSREEAMRFMANVKRFRFAGWSEMLKA